MVGKTNPFKMQTKESHVQQNLRSAVLEHTASFAVRLFLLAKMSSLSHFIFENWLNPKHVFWMPLTLLPIL